MTNPCEGPNPMGLPCNHVLLQNYRTQILDLFQNKDGGLYARLGPLKETAKYADSLTSEGVYYA